MVTIFNFISLFLPLLLIITTIKNCEESETSPYLQIKNFPMHQAACYHLDPDSHVIISKACPGVMQGPGLRFRLQPCCLLALDIKKLVAAPLGEIPTGNSHGPWRGLDQGQGPEPAQGEDTADGLGCTLTALLEKGTRVPPSREPTLQVRPEVPLTLRANETQDKQVGREIPKAPGPGPRQRWPLLRLGLAMVAHGLLSPTATLQSRVPDSAASVGSSRSSLWRLWGRLTIIKIHPQTNQKLTFTSA
ncbi:uncharacterized protein LOC141582653 [Saimiri boliviensis]|uniref:uncharacterized protein LOC141582653 n=1 Tax=Saimiri boliviensis TaxID=27679 RepID=UPI003D77E226